MGHQFEAQLGHIDAEFFWREFVGAKGVAPHYTYGGTEEESKPSYWKEGRCGCCHFPPNGRYNYDYDNTEFVMSDIGDWSPDPGRLKMPVNKDLWAKKRFFQADIPVFKQATHWQNEASPYVTEDGQSGWLTAWFQSFPSDTPITFNRTDVQTSRGPTHPLSQAPYTLENWWDILYDWDNSAAMVQHEAPPGNPPLPLKTRKGLYR